LNVFGIGWEEMTATLILQKLTRIELFSRRNNPEGFDLTAKDEIMRRVISLAMSCSPYIPQANYSPIPPNNSKHSPCLCKTTNKTSLSNQSVSRSSRQGEGGDEDEKRREKAMVNVTSEISPKVDKI
jgi:hypothetical protein